MNLGQRNSFLMSIEFVTTVSLPVHCDNKMDDREFWSAQILPHDHVIVYPVVENYSPVTEELNKTADPQESVGHFVTYQTTPLHQGAGGTKLSKAN